MQPESEPWVDRMTLEDLEQVLTVERLSFPTPWSRRAFITELTENGYACYLVVRKGAQVLGYAGIWLILDEAHVTNVAVHPDQRGKGIGHLLMAEIVRRCEERGCSRITLEVRRSNQIAQHLYASFGFVSRGVRKGYYTDNHEDAFIMVRDQRGDEDEA